MQNEESISVLIQIALIEELREFLETNNFSVKDEEILETFPFYRFHFFDVSNKRRSGIICAANGMASKVRDCVTIFCKQFKPQLIINIGISGRIGSDAKVGDIVVPDQVVIVDHRAATSDTEAGSYEMNAGGQSVSVDRTCQSLVSSISFTDKANFSSLDEYIQASNISLSEKEKAFCSEKQLSGELNFTPKIIKGPFASGSFVAKSSNFAANVLKGVNRNFIAFDMESGFVGDTINAISSMNSASYFAVRGISDPGNRDKKLYDNIADGIFRRWTMTNITKTVKSLLGIYAFQSLSAAANNSLNVSAELGSLGTHYIPHFPGQQISDAFNLELNNKRFSNLFVQRHEFDAPQRKNKHQIKFEYFLDTIKNKPKDGMFLVSGHGGCGKSALLQIAKINLEHHTTRSDCIFLSMRTIIEHANFDDLEDSLKNIMLDQSPNFTIKNSNKYVFIDELYGKIEEENVIRTIFSILHDVIPTYIFAFGEDHFEILRISQPSYTSPYIHDYNYDGIFELKNIHPDDKECSLKIIEGIAQNSNSSKEADPEQIYQQIYEKDFKYINHFIVSIFLDNHLKKSFENIRSSTNFILKAMNIHYDNIKNSELTNFAFEDICIESLRSHCIEFSKNCSPKERENIWSAYKEYYAHFPKAAQTVLIANAIVYILGQYHDANEEIFKKTGFDKDVFFSLVFSSDVNSCLKDLMLDPNTEERMLAAAGWMLHDERSSSFALYLFGRAQSSKGKRLASTAFSDARKSIITNAKLENEYSHRLSKEEKFRHLARRTLYISMSKIGDKKATDEYIELVITSNIEESLNRNFHLEYYGDQQNTGMTVELELDTDSFSWKRTKGVLSQHIANAIAAGKCDEYDRICILTYFTFVRHRHEQGVEDANACADHRTLISKLFDADLYLGSALTHYLTMLLKNLEKEKYDYLDCIVELFKLKTTPRFGWTERRMFNDSNVALEGVAAHTFGAILLADLLIGSEFLPGEFNKNKVIEYLIAHDIGESIVGDHGPNDGDKNEKERIAIERIKCLSSYAGMSNLQNLSHRFKEFSNFKDKEASLANDFDKLDPVFQGFIYASKFPNVENRRIFFRYHINKLENVELQKIAAKITERAEEIAIDIPDELPLH